jgi:hypothetical protein
MEFQTMDKVQKPSSNDIKWRITEGGGGKGEDDHHTSYFIKYSRAETCQRLASCTKNGKKTGYRAAWQAGNRRGWGLTHFQAV